ncbi:methyl-accepting chemotaxis protein [Bremerella sp. JC817]|uniref:methyl-accepting chemotaxis protein n=1 Tax=Bremerella sp. JC817 TaxID=3231756 RepID=UPI00345AD68A
MFGLISTRLYSWRNKSEHEAKARQAAQQLHEARAIVDALHRSNAVIEFNLDGTIITANELFLQTLGYSLPEIVGKHHRMFVTPEYAVSEEYRQFWDKLRTGAGLPGRFLRVAKDGSKVYIQASYNPVYDVDGNLCKIVKFATDVTQQVEAHQKATRLQNMLERLPLNIMFADLDMVIRYINPASLATFKKIADLLPVKPDKIVGAPLSIFHSNPQVQHNILSDPGNLPMSTEFRLGPEVIRLNVSAIYDAEGKYIGPMACWGIETEKAEVRGRVSNLAEVGNSVATSVSEMAIAMDEIGLRITRNAELAEDTNHQVSDAGSWIRQLSESSQEIGGIIGTIQELAEQTNLLALNATIESARAGEAGRGFAVVANEVKSLANSTSDATKNIAERINSIRENINRVVDTNTHITGSISEVNQNSNTIAAAVEEQNAIVHGMKQTADELVMLADELKKL